MDGGGTPGQNRNNRFLLQAAVWFIALWWSSYLITNKVHEGSNGFEVAVQAIGSLGILLALFLVMKPRSDAWNRAHTQAQMPGEEPEVTEAVPLTAGRWALITITLALAVGAIAYHLMHGSSLHQSVVFFIGVPAVLAVILSLTPKAKSATGVIVKG